MEKEVILKRAVFGGFNRKQVMEYIASLHEQAGEIKENIKELEVLKQTVAELEAEIIEKDNMIKRLNEEIEAAKSSALLGRASANLMKESVNYVDCYVRKAKELADDMSERTDECVASTKGKIEGIMESLGNISDSILDLYNSMDSFKGEHKAFCDAFSDSKIVSDFPAFGVEQSRDVEKINANNVTVGADSKVKAQPSDDDVNAFLRSMEAKYRQLLRA